MNATIGCRDCSNTIEPYANDGDGPYATGDQAGRCATCNSSAVCACCGAQFERDPVFPEVASCDMCNAGESPGMERLPTDAELRDVNYQLNCGIAGVAP